MEEDYFQIIVKYNSSMFRKALNLLLMVNRRMPPGNSMSPLSQPGRQQPCPEQADILAIKRGWFSNFYQPDIFFGKRCHLIKILKQEIDTCHHQYCECNCDKTFRIIQSIPGKKSFEPAFKFLPQGVPYY